jgi:Spy/CpxP family protein refolding chaperone
MRKTWLIAFLAIIFITVISAPTIAQDRKPEEKIKLRAGGRDFDVMKKLKLTDEQKQKLKDLRFDLAKDMAKLRADLKVAKVKVVQVNQARSKMLQRSVDHRLELKKILTPEQQEKLRSIRDWGRFLGRGAWQERPFRMGEMKERIPRRMLAP